jgi:hypothetical protein
VVNGAFEENTSGVSRCQFVGRFGGEIRIAGTTEYAQVLIGGGDSLEGEVWVGCADLHGGEAVSRYVVVWSPSIQ